MYKGICKSVFDIIKRLLARIVKDTHRENTPSNKTEALTKCMNMYIWEIGILNQLLLRNPYTQIEFSEKQSSRWQKSNSL